MAEPKKLLVFSIYSRQIRAIIQYDTIQTFYRFLSAMFLLVSFGAIGHMVTSPEMVIPLSRLVLVMFICLGALILNTVLWRLDLIYTERLLLSRFFSALMLEKDYHWLPQVHTEMVHGTTHDSCPAKKVWYYIISGVSLLLILCLSFYIYVHHHFYFQHDYTNQKLFGFYNDLGDFFGSYYDYYIPSLFILGAVVYAWSLVRSTQSFELLSKELKKKKRSHERRQ